MSTPAAPEKGRLRQMRQAYRMTKQTDKRIGLILILWFVLVAGAIATAGILLLGTGVINIISTSVLALLSGLLAVLYIFGSRAEKSMYGQAEGRLGAGGQTLTMLKRGWFLKQAVAITKNQDVVHRVVGRPGVVLVGEGNPTRVRNLLVSERKKHARIAGEGVPITTIVIGRGDDEVPLPKLLKHVKKLPKKIKPGEQTAVINKLKALDAMRPVAPMPRGPMPTSTKGARKMMRG